MPPFKVISDFQPAGDQGPAIEVLTQGIQANEREQTLLGVTGSGKTFTIAKLIEQIQRPALVIAHNKTLAAQLYSEFKEFFPNNAVEYFVSYYDYYQPEAYIPATDTYIEKDSHINDEIDRLRLSTTRSLMERRDVIVVASVSCIYGLGSPKEWREMTLMIELGQQIERKEIQGRLVDIQYERNDVDFTQGAFRVRGDTVEVFPAMSNLGVRIELFGEEVERISEFDPLTGHTLHDLEKAAIYPARHYVMPIETVENAISSIKKELEVEVENFRSQGKLLEAQRLEQRTKFDIEMMREIGYCKGIENYSRHMEKRAAGEPPFTLLDFFPEDYIVVTDESHVMLPQIKGMHNGDRARKDALVSNGFRLPSAYDNRPLRIDEFFTRINQIIYVSATPGDFELERSSRIVEQIIRPTGLVDPEVVIRPVEGQVDDLVAEIRRMVDKGSRILVTTLTKRMAEDLSEYLLELDIKGRYMHSDIDTLERVEIIRSLRLGEFDVLVGINLLREGLDLPEVALVAILDADKEGFLRSERSLIQTIGRASRNIEGRVILYADTITGSISRAVDETNRRRRIQTEYNRQHQMTPRSITKAVRGDLVPKAEEGGEIFDEIPREEILNIIIDLEAKMHAAAKQLEFEKAADLRDKIKGFKTKLEEMDMVSSTSLL
ncbi:MAG: excinuclease ABC subunit UvrB [Methanosarcinales archaeon]|nr:excinuclease ABC subunit UvrB [Methanosarcinales archaeon]